MPRMLITSPCETAGGVYLLDTRSGEWQHVFPQSCRGITRGPHGYYVVTEKAGAIYRLDPHTWESRKISSPGFKGCHDLRWTGEEFYLAACRGNYVVRLDRRGQVRDTMQIVPHEGDVCHVNCIALVGERPILSVFTLAPGVREEKNRTRSWRRDGKVLALDWSRRSYEILYQPLAQPHSLVSENGSLFCCESFSSTLVRLSLDRRRREVLRRLTGFVRGLALTENFAYVGISRTRAEPSFRQQILERLPPSLRSLLQPPRHTPQIDCGVLALSRSSWTIQREFPLPAREVYEILLLDRPRRGPS